MAVEMNLSSKLVYKEIYRLAKFESEINSARLGKESMVRGMTIPDEIRLGLEYTPNF
jgi:hypothetical protein